MAHFALIENGKVTNIIVLNNTDVGEPDLSFPETEKIGQEFISNMGLSGEWKQCSYSGSFRGYYPSIGSIYDEDKDIFIPIYFVNINGTWLDPKDVPES